MCPHAPFYQLNNNLDDDMFYPLISNDFLGSIVVHAIILPLYRYIRMTQSEVPYNMGGGFLGGGQKTLSAMVGVEMKKKFLDHPPNPYSYPIRVVFLQGGGGWVEKFACRDGLKLTTHHHHIMETTSHNTRHSRPWGRPSIFGMTGHTKVNKV